MAREGTEPPGALKCAWANQRDAAVCRRECVGAVKMLRVFGPAGLATCRNLKFTPARTVWMATSLEPWSGLVPPVAIGDGAKRIRRRKACEQVFVLECQVVRPRVSPTGADRPADKRSRLLRCWHLTGRRQVGYGFAPLFPDRKVRCTVSLMGERCVFFGRCVVLRAGQILQDRR